MKIGPEPGKLKSERENTQPSLSADRKKLRPLKSPLIF
jgi:hypothetical protein